jgi:tetratricopeptide (TPR) repeat protein
MTLKRWTLPLLASAALLLPLDAADPTPPPDREAAYRANNLGVAMLEQFHPAEAAAAFRRALALDPKLGLARINLAIALFYVPDLPGGRAAAEEAAAAQPAALQPPYILGLIARMENRADDAVVSLRGVLAADPQDVGANLTLGQVYLQQRRYDEAIACFRAATAVEPYNASAQYNLGVALTRAGRREEGARATARFQELRENPAHTSFGQAYLEQGRYAEALASTGAEADLVDARPPEVAFVDVSAGGLPAFAAGAPPALALGRKVRAKDVLAAAGAGTRAAITLFDYDGDGALDLVVAGPSGLRLLHNEGGRFRDVTASSGLEAGPALGAVAGDYDNDGRVDLLVLRPGRLALYHNDGGGRFSDQTAKAGIPAYPYLSVSAAFVDVDHDGDLDILVAGLADLAATARGPGERALVFPKDFAPAPSRLLRNNGNGTFTDITDAARVGAAGHAIAIVPTDFDNHRDVDLLVLYEDAPPRLFKNLRDGSFQDVAAEVGLKTGDGPFRSVAAADVNKDGYTDFFFGAASGPGLFALSDGRGGFTLKPAPAETAGAMAAQFVDYDNDGLLDLLVATPRGLRLFRNTGGAFTDVSARAFPEGRALTEGVALALADLDGDGDEDVVVATPESGPQLWRNEGGNKNHSLPVRLAGRVSNKGGVGAKVDLRAGSLRQRIETSSATPAVAPADVLFGLGPRPGPDAVRVIWASGIVQTEVPPEASAWTSLRIEELDRKPSSCPFLYAWNGERFEFVTDFLGGGEMGYWEAPGQRNRPYPEEYVRIRGDQLQPKDGRYELRITNELEEVLFLDHVELLAVAHPEDVSVFPNEGMTDPPKPFRLFAVRRPEPPSAASDDQGRDVRARIARLDRTYPDAFALLPIRGYAEEHGLVLDLAGLPASATSLLLTGWTDYAFSSDNLAAHQAGLSLRPPSLQVQDAGGAWQTVIEDLGIPVGRPQTMVVDLEGKWRGPSRRLRILTNMRVYWDQVLLGTPAPEVPLAPTPLEPVGAELRARGFSAEVSPDRHAPFVYDYARVSSSSPWKVMPGRYTREGDVRELLAASDDLFVVARPGDEIALSFDARALPPLPGGWTRTFLLHGDGFSKEMDINSASPDVVLPLPFHGMKSYPYPPSEAPARVRRQAERAEAFNTRVVARPLAPLELASVAQER